MDSVLLSDGLLRKTLATTRSLGRRGVHVTVAENTFAHPAGKSKYCARSVKYPDPLHDGDAFLEWLISFLKSAKPRVFIPMDDGSMDVCVRAQSVIRNHTNVLVPRIEAYDVARDKKSAVSAAMASGLVCPTTYMPDSFHYLENLLHTLNYPIVVKPRFSSGSRGIRVVQSSTELIREYTAIHKDYPWPLIQEYIAPGDRYDVCILMNTDGNTLASFVQREIRHFPIPFGPSTAQESVSVPALVTHTERLLKDIGWHGIAEVEYMVNPVTGAYTFMEINTRFWNSLYLSVLAGVDFPWLLYQASLGKKVEPIVTYRVGIRCRSLIPLDLLHYLTNPQRQEMNPPLFARKADDVFDDVLSRDDPGATIGLLLAMARKSCDGQAWKSMFFR